MKKKIVRISPWHFVTAIITFYFLTNVMYELLNKEEVITQENYILKPMEEIQSNRLSFVLVHDESSICNKMKNNMESLASESCDDADFFEVDANQNTDFLDQYNVSGLPNILVFNDGRECMRLMGLISLENLKTIYTSLAKKYLKI
ncbi:MAG: thioredoxin family protein [Dysgonamonadaceae bacterium]|jgi:thioredoxin-like negative regulator of GroEL|nr:thioredoxin family protein [Dysgonamonadaceae bacterium]